MNLKTFIPVAAAVAFCFSACSNDDTKGGAPDPTVDEGDPANVTITISEPRTRTADDTYATSAETDFYFADVFIYSGNSLVKHQRLEKSAFTEVGSGDHVWRTTQPIVTTEGFKDIYVGLNLPEALGEEIASNGSKAGIELAYRADTYPLASMTDGFVMFSNEVRTVDLLPVSAGINSITVDVERIVAKVTVQKGEKLDLDVIGGTVGNLEFAIRNSNLLFFPMQQKDASQVVNDPNHVKGSYQKADFSQGTDYAEVDEYATGPLLRNVKYTAENTTEMKYQWETTYASVKAVFVPEKFTDAAGDLYDNPNSDPDQQGTFWVVRLKSNGDTYCFEDEVTAEDFADDNDGEDPVEYADGLCYYNLFLNPSGGYQTLRNTFYQCVITTIMGIGNADPEEGGDKEIPIAEQANIVADINILPWSVRSDDYDLF